MPYGLRSDFCVVFRLLGGRGTVLADTQSPAFAQKPSMFFSVCLGVLEKDNAQAQADERQIVESLFARTGWRPQMWAIVAGAITYTKYNWLIRFVMKRIAKKAGGGTDTSQDYEYTDWDEVRRTAREFASRVE